MIVNILALVFYLVFIYYAFLGVYGLMLNRNKELNKVYFAMSVSLAIWTISFAISNVLTDYEAALFWRRFASLGWGTVFSIITHFSLLLTKENNRKMKKSTYTILYLPSLIIIFIFGLNNSTAISQFSLIKTQFGWTNIIPNNRWDMFYNLYYIGFTLFSLFLLLVWLKKSTTSKMEKVHIYLLLSIFVAIILGSFSEMILNNFLTEKIPSVAPIIALLPVSTMLYVIKKQHLLLPYRHKGLDDSSPFASDIAHKNFFNYVAVIFLVGAFLNVLHFLYYQGNPLHIIAVSTFIVFSGLIVYSVPKFGMASKQENWILTAIISLVIPIVLFSFLEEYSSNSVWPIPILFLMMTIIFNKRNMFKLVAIISTLTFLFSWLLKPLGFVTINSLDYFSRILIYLMAIILAHYINSIYTIKLKENNSQINFHQVVSLVSASFVNVTEKNMDLLIDQMLDRLSLGIGADRAYFGILSENNTIVTFKNQWLINENNSEEFLPVTIKMSDFEWLNKQLINNDIVFVSSLESLPSEAEAEKTMMQSTGIYSFLYIPMMDKGVVIGFIGFYKMDKDHDWVIHNFDLLKATSNILSESLRKVDNDKKMHELAYLDVLTKLPNRSLLASRLENSVSYAKRKNIHVGILFIDLDGFKAVNDTLGHNWGDELLVTVGQRLVEAVRSYDTVARFGGDKFIVMIPDVTRLVYMEEVANKVISVFEEAITINSQDFHITASAGIAIYPNDGNDADTLIKNADLAMYEAKKNGKNQHAWCTETMKTEIKDKMSITNALYLALDNNEIRLVYQPQICLETMKIIGVEALIRWEHPEFGFVPPSTFIPIAEQTGLIHKVGDWIIKEACQQLKTWQIQGIKPVRMAINISIEQFKSGNLLDIITETINRLDLNPDHLEFEITEGIAMKESDQISDTLNTIKKLGATISIDDFGTEYSSFDRLIELPIDRLKIDMQFIKSIGNNKKDESLINVMVYLAKSLGLGVIAEGVETLEQLEYLRKINCDEIQGYYCYKPLSVEDITGALSNQNS